MSSYTHTNERSITHSESRLTILRVNSKAKAISVSLYVQLIPRINFASLFERNTALLQKYYKIKPVSHSLESKFLLTSKISHH